MKARTVPYYSGMLLCFLLSAWMADWIEQTLNPHDQPVEKPKR